MRAIIGHIELHGTNYTLHSGHCECGTRPVIRHGGDFKCVACYEKERELAALENRITARGLDWGGKIRIHRTREFADTSWPTAMDQPLAMLFH